MPYIKQERREELDPTIFSLFEKIETVGEMNYTITCLLQLFIKKAGKSYATLNTVYGLLHCIDREFGRRLLDKYEDEKIEENGDVMLC